MGKENELLRHKGVLIRTLPDRRKCYLVDYRRGALKRRKAFKTMGEAKRYAASVALEAKAYGDASPISFSDPQRIEASEAYGLLAGRASLVEAARYWLKYHPDTGAMTYNELVDKYRAHLEGQRVRPTTLRGLWRLERVGRTVGKQAVVAITSADLAGWLDGRGLSPVNRNNYRRALSALFNYAVGEGVATVNPLARVPVVKVEAPPVTFWTAEQVRRLLHVAEAAKPEMVPMLAIMALAGLRPGEAEKLCWESINLAEKIIRVEGATSKTRQRRVVPMEDNLVAWLVKYRQKSGPVAPRAQTLRRWRERITAASLVPDWQTRVVKAKELKGTDAAEAGLTWEKIVADAKVIRKELWPPDVLRHSYASHWLPVFHDENKLAGIMGNSPDVVHRNYRALVTEAEATPYWSILPSGAGKLIPMEASA